MEENTAVKLHTQNPKLLYFILLSNCAKLEAEVSKVEKDETV